MKRKMGCFNFMGFSGILFSWSVDLHAASRRIDLCETVKRKPVRTELDNQEFSHIPFQQDPVSGIWYREITVKKNGRPETFIEQKCVDGDIFRWRKIKDALPIFPRKLTTSLPEGENDVLAKKVLLYAFSGDLENLVKTLLQCDDPEVFVEQYSDILFRVRKRFEKNRPVNHHDGGMGRCASLASLSKSEKLMSPGGNAQIQRKIIDTLVRFGYHNVDD